MKIIPNIFLALLVMVCLVFISPLNAQAELFMNISGSVIESAAGVGLQNVKVVLMSKTNGKVAEATSDTTGKFIFQNIKQGVYDLLTSSDDTFLINSKSTVPVTVPNGKNVVGVNVKMQRGSAIKGRAITSTGIPVKQAKITGGGAFTSVDMDGNFVLKGISPGATQIGIFPTAIGSKLLSASVEVGKITDLGNIVFAVGTATAIQGTVVDSHGTVVKGAVLIAYNNTSAGYAFSSNDGSFFITGLDVGQYSLVAVAYGYVKSILTNINVPAAGVNVVLTPSLAQTSSVLQYRFASIMESEKKIISKVMELVTPDEAIATQCKKGSCQDGTWLGVSVDFGGTAVIPGLLGSANGSTTAAGTFSIGSFFCWNSSGSIQFTETCTYLGGTTNNSKSISIDPGFGLTPFIIAWDACCTEDIEGPTTGSVLGLSRAAGGTSAILSKFGVAGAVGYDTGNPASFLSFSLAAGAPSSLLIDELNKKRNSQMGRLSPEGSDIFASYRSCQTDEAANIFEWWLGAPSQ